MDKKTYVVEIKHKLAKESLYYGPFDTLAEAQMYIIKYVEHPLYDQSAFNIIHVSYPE